MLGHRRNQEGLTQHEIERSLQSWAKLQESLGFEPALVLDTQDAGKHGSRTRYNEERGVAYLGADVKPGPASDARSRMSELSCLAHELSHAERHRRGYDRPSDQPDALVDEAEASLNASFYWLLGPVNRADLIEDARDRLVDWLACSARSGQDGD